MNNICKKLQNFTRQITRQNTLAPEKHKEIRNDFINKIEEELEDVNDPEIFNQDATVEMIKTRLKLFRDR